MNFSYRRVKSRSQLCSNPAFLLEFSFFRVLEVEVWLIEVVDTDISLEERSADAPRKLEDIKLTSSPPEQ